MKNTKRYVLVTGCSTGIGLSIFKVLLSAGYQVIATARTPEALSLIRSEGAYPLHLDLDDEASIRLCVASVSELTDQLFALVNNAGYGQPGAIEDLEAQALRDQFETNVVGTMTLTRLCLPLMQGQGHRVIFITSILGVVPAPFLGAYCASKHALEALAGALQMEIPKRRIAVTCIRPGAIDSQFRHRVARMLRERCSLENSQHVMNYEKTLSSLNTAEQQKKRAAPTCIARLVLKILNRKHPPRLLTVITPARAISALRRILPWRAIEWIIRVSFR